MRDPPKTSSNNKVATYHKSENPGRSKKRKLGRGRKGLIESPVPALQHGSCQRHNMLCSRGAKRLNSTKEQEEQAQTSLHQGFAYVQALTQLEIRRRKIERVTSTDKAKPAAARQARGPLPKAVTKSISFGDTEERRKYSSIIERLNLEPIYRESLRFENQTILRHMGPHRDHAG